VKRNTHRKEGVTKTGEERWAREEKQQKRSYRCGIEM
jgi:hypothetical protein